LKDGHETDLRSRAPVVGTPEDENAAAVVFLAYQGSMKKILMLVDQFPPLRGGVSIWMEKLASLMGVSHEVVVADLSESGENRRPDTPGFSVEKYTGFPYRAIRETVRSAERASASPRMECFANVLKLFLLMRPEELVKLFFVLKLIKTHRLTRSDRILVSNPASMGFYAVFTRFFFGIPFAAVCHGGELLYHRSLRIESKKLSAVLNGADVLIANSHFTKRLLVETGCAPSGIRVVHPGVDVRHFVPGPKDRRLIGELGIGNRIVLLTVAHLVEHKNHLGVLAVLAALIGKYPNLHYLIMGNGTYGKRIEEETLRLGLKDHVTFLKQVSYGDLPRYYRLCDVYIMLSRRLAQSVEGFGIAFLEAGACGKPAIGMDAGGIPDAVEHDRSGFLAGGMKDAIEKAEILIGDAALRRKMGEYARRRCESRFTWEDSVRRIEDALFSRDSSGR
jgi:phosphatidyl-myo-inositol dimannoside synthase